MANSIKQAPFHWEYGEELVSLKVGQYEHEGGLYINIISYTEDGPESFADATINIPYIPLNRPNEAYISGDLMDDILRFIKEQKLGEELPQKVRSNFGVYSAVSFNLDKLAEFDPQGVAAYKKSRNIPDTSCAEASRAVLCAGDGSKTHASRKLMAEAASDPGLTIEGLHDHPDADTLKDAVEDIADGHTKK